MDRGGSEREAAAIYGVTRSVLQHWKRRNRDEIPFELSQGSFTRVFTDAQEQVILAFIFELAEKFYAMTRRALGELAFHLAERNHRVHKFKDGVAGTDWIASFILRHKDVLSLRTGTRLSLIRIQSFTKKNVYHFFDQLEAVIIKNGYDEHTIFNVDETGISVVASRAPKRLARKGVRSVPVLVAVERGQLVTMTVAANAAGKFIPPMFIFPLSRQYIEKNEAPEGSIFVKTPKGWSTSKAFLVWLKHFRNNAPDDKKKTVLLILDNHSSHICHDSMMFCKDHHIDLLTLPPHTTHKTQPLDVSFFSPLKSNYGNTITQWLAEHPMRKPRSEDIPGIIKKAYLDAYKRSNAVSGFAKTGIYLQSTNMPDRAVFAETDFAPDPEEDCEQAMNCNDTHGNDYHGDDGNSGSGPSAGHYYDESELHNSNAQGSINPDNGGNSGENSLNAAFNRERESSALESEEEVFSDSRNPFYSPLPSENESSGSGTNESVEVIPNPVSFSTTAPFSLNSTMTFGDGLTSAPEVLEPPDFQADFSWKDPLRTKPLVEYGSSSDDEPELEDRDYFEDAGDHIFTASDETVGMNREVEMLHVGRHGSVRRQVDKSSFAVGPWDMVKTPESEPAKKRKTRAKQKSELMTSEENIRKLKEKEKAKRKKTSSDSEERRLTRTCTRAQQRKLRSGKNV